MTKQTETITDEVQAIRNDRKGIQILGEWYQSNFNPISNDINKGDNVKIEFKRKGSFKNITKIEKVQTEKPIEIPAPSNKTETKINYELKESRTNKDVIASQLMSYSKDILLCFLNNGKQVELGEISDWVVKAYNKIKGGIK